MADKVKDVPTPADDVPGIRKELDALKGAVAALTVRVAAAEAQAMKDDHQITVIKDLILNLSSAICHEHNAQLTLKTAVADASAIVGDLMATLDGFLTQPPEVTDLVRRILARAREHRAAMLALLTDADK